MGADVQLTRGKQLLWALNIAALLIIGFAWVTLLQRGDHFKDTSAYWSIDYEQMYGGSLVGRIGTYLYSPAFADLVWPLTLLSWPVFAAIFSLLNLVALVWMAGPILAAILLFFPGSPVADEFSTGNIHLLLAASIVLGFRYPATWAFPLLTKVTPGIGFVWFIGRRAWRSVGIALGVTVVAALLSFALQPNAWFAWVDLLRQSSTVPSGATGVIPGPLLLRVAVAAGIALFAGYRNWRWLVPVAATIALPVTWSSGLAILVGSIPLLKDAWRRRRSTLSSDNASAAGPELSRDTPHTSQHLEPDRV